MVCIRWVWGFATNILFFGVGAFGSCRATIGAARCLAINRCLQPLPPITDMSHLAINQQFTYGVVSEGFCFAIMLQKFSRNLRRVRSNASGKSTEISGHFQTTFCNDPFPNDPISESLKLIRHLQSLSRGLPTLPGLPWCWQTWVNIWGN